MAEEFKNVLLMGASGHVGPVLLDGLLSEGKFNVTVTSRQESKATFPDHVKVIKTDYSGESLVKAFQGQDVVISTIGGTAIGDQKTMIEAAVKAGVKRFLPSEFGSDTSNKKAQEICPIFTAKTEVVDMLKAKAAENPNFSWSGLMTGPFFDWCVQTAFFGFDVKSHTATIWDSGNKKWSSATLATVRKAVLALLSHPAETKNRYVWIESFSVSQNEVLAALEKNTGQKWQVNKVASADQIREGRESMARGDFMGIVKLIIGAMFAEEADLEMDFSKVAQLDNDVLGLPKEDLQTVVDDMLKEAS